jgi:hypothetical protein
VRPAPALRSLFTFARLDRAILFQAVEKDAPVKPGQGESEALRRMLFSRRCMLRKAMMFVAKRLLSDARIALPECIEKRMRKIVAQWEYVRVAAM